MSEKPALASRDVSENQSDFPPRFNRPTKIAVVALLVVGAVAFILVRYSGSSTIHWETSGHVGPEVTVIEHTGSKACGWEGETFLDIRRVDTYVRDPDNTWGPISVPVLFEADASVPPELLLHRDSASPEAVYVVSPDGVERWPRVDVMCMDDLGT